MAVVNTTARSLKHLAFLDVQMFTGNPPQIVNYYGDSDLLFCTAGSLNCLAAIFALRH